MPCDDHVSLYAGRQGTMYAGRQKIREASRQAAILSDRCLGI